MTEGKAGAFPPALVARLEEARRAEKEQALTYRGLAADAEASGQPEIAARFHDLHADEQHHLSRLTARLLELRQRPVDLADVRGEVLSLDGWEGIIRRREAVEVQRYEALIEVDGFDASTRSLLEEILRVERHHGSELGGKWTAA